MQDTELRVGLRLQIGSERATVRFIGAIDAESGKWVGLEWDNPDRGKHDGAHKGRRYFTCAYGGESNGKDSGADLLHCPLSCTTLRRRCGKSSFSSLAESTGSFVRLPKLLQTARLGHSVLEGLQARYQGAVGSALHCGSGVIDFRLIGEQTVRAHQGQLQLLKKASLAGDCVSGPVRQQRYSSLQRSLHCHYWAYPVTEGAALHTPVDGMQGPDGELGAAVPALAELDLSSSLVDSWNSVLSIMRELPALRLINLSHTRMWLPSRMDRSWSGVTSLQAIVLNNCHVSWSQVSPSGSCCMLHETALKTHPLW